MRIVVPKLMQVSVGFALFYSLPFVRGCGMSDGGNVTEVTTTHYTRHPRYDYHSLLVLPLASFGTTHTSIHFGMSVIFITGREWWVYLTDFLFTSRRVVRFSVSSFSLEIASPSGWQDGDTSSVQMSRFVVVSFCGGSGRSRGFLGRGLFFLGCFSGECFRSWGCMFLRWRFLLWSVRAAGSGLVSGRLCVSVRRKGGGTFSALFVGCCTVLYTFTHDFISLRSTRRIIRSAVLRV